MKRAALFLLLLGCPAFAQVRPVHTFSIVARDPQTGEIGAAVQSHWFAVGSIVVWAEPGVGAVATQSFVDPSYGPRGLELMRSGKRAGEALRQLLDADQGREVRQVAFIDATGAASTFTGGKDIPAAGGIAGMPGGGSFTAEDVRNGYLAAAPGQIRYGANFAVQANLMDNDTIWPAMAKAYQETKGDLAERMLAALDAAQRAGGDIRGRQSAALIVVSGERTKKPWEKLYDVRVDDHPQPLLELRRLVTLQRAYNHMNAGDAAVEHKDNEGALREYAAAEQLVANRDDVLPSRKAEMMYWHAVALVNMGRVDESLPIFRRVFSIDKQWAKLTPRLPKVGLLPDDPKLVDKILGQSITLSQRKPEFCQTLELNGHPVRTCTR